MHTPPTCMTCTSHLYHDTLSEVSGQGSSEHSQSIKGLVPPYCASHRKTMMVYLSDIPLLRDMGFSVSQHGQLGAIPPPPFLSVCPLEYMRSRGAIPPPPPLKRGISAILARYPLKTRQMGAIPPSVILSRKGTAAVWGVISHWAPWIKVLMKIVLLLELGLLFGSTLPLLVPLLCIGISSERLLAAVGWHRGCLKAPPLHLATCQEQIRSRNDESACVHVCFCKRVYVYIHIYIWL